MRPTGKPGYGVGTRSLCAAGLAALALAGCSQGIGGVGGLGLGGGQLPYQASNAIAPSGYSESMIAPDRYRIEVKGPMGTPPERMQKIAATRAAEIGKDMNLGYFKIDGVQQGTICQKYTAGSQNGTKTTAKKQLQYSVLTADVTYAKQPLDASYVQAKPAFDQYRAELDLPQAGGLPPDAAALGAQCS
jgi:hypothetical protein